MKYIAFLFIIPILGLGQNAKLSAFKNLTGKTWVANGNWGDGSKFKQETTFSYAMDSTIVIANSKGFVDKEQTKYGQRNHGIRQFDKLTNTIKFWEFDVFGGITSGTVTTKGKDIFYEYAYGGTLVTDMWKYVNDSTYLFKVGSYTNEKWEQTFLETKFIANALSKKAAIYSKMKTALLGQWSSKAWDGVLNEVWSIDENGYLLQSAKYMEGGKVLYEANTKIEWIANEIILSSIIKNSNPKIYKATSFDENRIVFENSDYKNPTKVVYQLHPNNVFHRQISGVENNKPTSYTFKFKRMAK